MTGLGRDTPVKRLAHLSKHQKIVDVAPTQRSKQRFPRRRQARRSGRHRTDQFWNTFPGTFREIASFLIHWIVSRANSVVGPLVWRSLHLSSARDLKRHNFSQLSRDDTAT